MKKKVSKIIEDDDESEKHENQDPNSKKSLINKNAKEKNTSAPVEYSKKNLDRAISDNNMRTNKDSNFNNDSSELKFRDFYPNKTVNLNHVNDSFMNSVHLSGSNYSNNNNYQKSYNYGGEKTTNIIIPKKVLSEFPITYEEVRAKMKEYYNKKLLQRRIQSANFDNNKPNENESFTRDAISLKKNEQVNSCNINSQAFEEKIKKKLGNNVAKNPVVEHFNNTTGGNIFNNSGLKKANEHFGAFNPNNIIINSNNNYNNINLNIINKDRNNDADKNLIPKSIKKIYCKFFNCAE